MNDNALLNNCNNPKMFIAVPLDPSADPGDAFRRPDLFHIVYVDYETAACIGDSVFSKLAFESIDNYPIEPFEDPAFEPADVPTLLTCLEKWKPVSGTTAEKALQIVKNLLLEAKERGVGIYFKL